MKCEFGQDCEAEKDVLVGWDWVWNWTLSGNSTSTLVVCAQPPIFFRAKNVRSTTPNHPLKKRQANRSSTFTQLILTPKPLPISTKVLQTVYDLNKLLLRILTRETGHSQQNARNCPHNKTCDRFRKNPKETNKGKETKEKRKRCESKRMTPKKESPPCGKNSLCH